VVVGLDLDVDGVVVVEGDDAGVVDEDGEGPVASTRQAFSMRARCRAAGPVSTSACRIMPGCRVPAPRVRGASSAATRPPARSRYAIGRSSRPRSCGRVRSAGILLGPARGGVPPPHQPMVANNTDTNSSKKPADTLAASGGLAFERPLNEMEAKIRRAEAASRRRLAPRPAPARSALLEERLKRQTRGGLRTCRRGSGSTSRGTPSGR
jgi:hypothetical protein